MNSNKGEFTSLWLSTKEEFGSKHTEVDAYKEFSEYVLNSSFASFLKKIMGVVFSKGGLKRMEVSANCMVLRYGG